MPSGTVGFWRHPTACRRICPNDLVRDGPTGQGQNPILVRNPDLSSATLTNVQRIDKTEELTYNADAKRVLCLLPPGCTLLTSLSPSQGARDWSTPHK